MNRGRGIRGSVVESQCGDEGFLGHFHTTDVLHLLLALFLLLEELPLAGDVAAVTLRQDILPPRLDRLACEDPASDRRLDGYVEHLAGDQLAQLFGHAPPVEVGLRPVDDGGERVHRSQADFYGRRMTEKL